MMTGLWSPTELGYKTISLVLLVFKTRWLASHHCTRLSIVLKQAEGLLSLCRRLKMAASSENLKTWFPGLHFLQPLVYSVKRTGELNQPCWAPIMMNCEMELLTWMYWVWLVRKVKCHLIKKWPTLIHLNFGIKRGGWSVLKAEPSSSRECNF